MSAGTVVVHHQTPDGFGAVTTTRVKDTTRTLVQDGGALVVSGGDGGGFIFAPGQWSYTKITVDPAP